MATKKAAKVKGKRVWVWQSPNGDDCSYPFDTKEQAEKIKREVGQASKLKLLSGILYPVPTKKRAVK